MFCWRMATMFNHHVARETAFGFGMRPPQGVSAMRSGDRRVPGWIRPCTDGFAERRAYAGEGKSAATEAARQRHAEARSKSDDGADGAGHGGLLQVSRRNSRHRRVSRRP